MSKQVLQEAFDFLPEGLAEFLDTPIPSIGSITSPSTVDEAIMAQGQLAKNINDILKAFEGLHLIKIFMHLAQHNEVLQLIGGATVQYLWANSDFTIIEPNENVSYAPGENTVSIQITAGLDKVQTVSCSAYRGSSGVAVSMSPDNTDPSLYIGDITYEVGEYEFTFVVNFDGNKRAKVISIIVEG